MTTRAHASSEISSTQFFNAYPCLLYNVHAYEINRASQSVVFDTGQKMALRVFYFIRTLTKALTYYYINRSQCHILVAIESNQLRTRTYSWHELGPYLLVIMYCRKCRSYIEYCKSQQLGIKRFLSHTVINTKKLSLKRNYLGNCRKGALKSLQI